MHSWLLLVGLLPAAIVAGGWNPNCITKPVGFGYKTTGGAGGRTVTPTNTKELVAYLGSSEKLIVELDRTFDFTDSEGYTYSTGCYFLECGRGFEESLAHAGTCNGRPQTTVKYAKAGLTEIIVSSHKTIVGKNRYAAIKGKGLRIKNAQNVIIRDITISDINPEVIWAGDALSFDKVQNVWIHGVTFARIGRQHLVSYQDSNTGITVSSCYFDGTSTTSAYCDGKQYWVWLFWGTQDEITLINNHVYNTAGRTPHAGGWSRSRNYIHLIGNYMDQNPHTGIEPREGSYTLAEGNIFNDYVNVINPYAKGGYLALVNDWEQAEQCKKYFGENCKVNSMDKSKCFKTWFDAAVLNAFSKLDRTAVNGARAAVCV